MPKRHELLFALDGVDNVSLSMYRRGSVYNRVIKNAQAFIEGGGNAVWQFIIFAFNEHMLDEVKRKAKDMGFLGTRIIASTHYDDQKYKGHDNFTN